MASADRPEAGRVTPRALVRLSACLSLDFRVSTDETKAPNQERHGGWTSAEDKVEFRRLVGGADILLMGRQTYRLMPRLGKPMAVVSALSMPLPGMTWVLRPRSAEVQEWLESLPGSVVLLCGGPMTYALMLGADLVDELYLTVEPVMLGVGPLFGEPASGFLQKYELVSHMEVNNNGTLQLQYRRKRDGHS